MKYIKLFLASSIVEFEHERNELGNYILSLNNYYVKHGIYLELVMCEDLSNAMAKASKQEEYNQFIGESDFFYIIFGRSAGQYTIEEFNVALEHFRNTKSPRIYTFFQKLPEGEKAASSVKDFMTRLSEELGHYFSTFSSLDSIKLNMLVEITRSKLLNEKIDIKDGKALINGREMLSLENIPIFKNNTKLQQLQEEISALRKERAELAVKFAENPEDMELYQKLTEVTDRSREITKQLHQLEKTILDICSTIAERNSSGKLVTFWEKEASRCLDEGDYEGALAILRDPAMDDELDHLDKMMDAREEELEVHINAQRFKIKTLMARGVNQKTLPEIYDCYEKCEKIAKKRKIETDIVYEYASFLSSLKDYEKAIPKAQWLRKFYDLEEKVEEYKKGDLYNLLGALYSNAKRPTEAEGYLKKAIELRERLVDENSATYSGDLALSYVNLGYLFYYYYTTRYTEAEKYLKKAIELWERLADENPAVYRADLAYSYERIGNIYSRTDRPGKADEYLKKAIELWERLADENPAAYTADLAGSYARIGNLYSRTDRPTEAEEFLKKRIELRDRLISEDPAAYSGVVAGIYESIGGFYRQKKQLTKAEEYLKKAIELRERLVDVNPAAYNGDLADGYAMLGGLYRFDFDKEKLTEAEKYYKKAIEIYVHLIQVTPGLYAGSLSISYGNLIGIYNIKKQLPKVENAYKSLIEIYEQLADNNFSGYADKLADLYKEIGEFYEENSDSVFTDGLSEAKSAYEKAISLWERMTKNDPCKYELVLAENYKHLGYLYEITDSNTEAVKEYEKAIVIYEKLSKDSDSKADMDGLMKLYENVGDSHRELKQFSEAEEAYRKSIGICLRLFYENPEKYILETGDYINQKLSDLQTEAEHFSEAENKLKELIDICEQLEQEESVNNDSLANIYRKVGNLYRETGQLDKAEETYNKSIGLYERLTKENPCEYTPALVNVYSDIGFLYHDMNERGRVGKETLMRYFSEAENEYKKAIKFYEELEKENPGEHTIDLALVYDNLGYLYEDTKRFDEAEELHKKAETYMARQQ